MVKNFILLFLALRAADLLNLFGGLYLVPKFVAPEDLGAVLPLTTFATLVAIPLFAVAMTALRESARLRSLHGEIPNRGGGLQSSAESDQQLRSFIRGVFAAVGILTVLTLAVTAALLPRYLVRLHIADSLSGYLAISAAFLGCVSPVYLDQLQAAKRFGCVGAIEISAAALRLAVMAVTMPVRALAGYFAGSVAKTLVQILGPLLALHRGEGLQTLHRGGGLQTIHRGGGLQTSANQEAIHHYWTRSNLLRLTKTFFLLLPYLALPMFVSWTENDLIRTLLPAEDSAGYYMATRISDLMNYITYPIMFVMFPYVTDRALRGESYRKMTLDCCGVIVVIALAMALISYFFGTEIIALLPNGEIYGAYAKHLPTLILFMAFGAGQSIITNAEVAAGRFSFLWWLLPLNIVYVELLPRLVKSASLESLVTIFMIFALVRKACALFQLRFSSDSGKSAR